MSALVMSAFEAV